MWHAIKKITCNTTIEYQTHKLVYSLKLNVSLNLIAIRYQRLTTVSNINIAMELIFVINFVYVLRINIRPELPLTWANKCCRRNLIFRWWFQWSPDLWALWNMNANGIFEGTFFWNYSCCQTLQRWELSTTTNFLTQAIGTSYH